MTHPVLTRAAPLLALPLAACLGLGGPPPPPTLFTLSSPPVASATRDVVPGQTVTVAVPGVPMALRTLRLPVRVSATEYAYLKDAQWVEPPNRLFQRLLSDAIAGRTGLVVLDADQTRIDPGRRITGQLLDFGLDTSDAQPRVRIRYDAVMTAPDGKVTVRRFDAERPVASEAPAVVAQALDAEAQALTAAVSDWVQGH